MDLVTFTGETLNEKLHFLCSEAFFRTSESILTFPRNRNRTKNCKTVPKQLLHNEFYDHSFPLNLKGNNNRGESL